MNLKDKYERILRSIYFCLPFLLASALHGQLALHIPQNVLTPGEKMWYGVIASADLKIDDQYPVVHVSLYNSHGNLEYQELYRPKDYVWTDFYSLPLDIGSGSYILSASIYDEFGYKVVLETSQIIHVLGQEEGSYYAFGSCNKNGVIVSNHQIEDSQDLNIIHGIREDICLEESDENALISVSSHETQMAMSQLKYQSDLINYQKRRVHRFVIEGLDKEKWLALYDNQQRKILVADINEVNNDFILFLPDSYHSSSYQPINAYSGSELTQVNEIILPPIWQCSKLTPIVMDKELAETIKSKAQYRSLIQEVFHTQDTTSSIKENTASKFPVPDRIIETKNFQSFESVELFIKEAVPAVRLSKRKNQKILTLVNGDRRGFYQGSPLLILDGRIETNIDSLLSIPFHLLKTLSIYRTEEKFNPLYGNLARYGVLIVKTNLGVDQNNGEFIKIIGLKTPANFHKQIPTKQNTTLPYLSTVQFFEKGKSGTFCYAHDDETGTFRFVSVNTKSLKSSEVIYDVKLFPNQ